MEGQGYHVEESDSKDWQTPAMEDQGYHGEDSDPNATHGWCGNKSMYQDTTGFFYALSSAFNKYGQRQKLWERGAGKVSPAGLAAALGSFLAFNSESKTQHPRVESESVTTDIIRLETLMGFSKKPLVGSLMHTIMQSPASRSVYNRDIENGKEVFLESVHIENLAHMTGCAVYLENVTGHTLSVSQPRNPAHNNPSIRLTAHSSLHEATATLKNLLISRVLIYTIKDSSTPSSVTFTADLVDGSET